MLSPLEIFRQKFLGPINQYMAWHDGYSAYTDFDCLDTLSSTDQQLAAAELLLALEKHNADPRAILGLGHLKYQPAIPVLHTYLATAGHYALEAIYRIDPARLDLGQVEDLLQARTSSAYVLQDLLFGLWQYYTRPQLSSLILQRVFELLVHPDYLVRYHALTAMRTFYGLTTGRPTLL